MNHERSSGGFGVKHCRIRGNFISVGDKTIASVGAISAQVCWVDTTTSQMTRWMETQFIVTEEDDFDIILDEELLNRHRLGEPD